MKVWYFGCGMKSGFEKEIAASAVAVLWRDETRVLTRHARVAPVFWVGSQIINPDISHPKAPREGTRPTGAASNDELADSPKWCVPLGWESRRLDADGGGPDDRAPQKIAMGFEGSHSKFVGNIRFERWVKPSQSQSNHSLGIVN